MGGNNKYQSTIGQNHSRRLGGIITAGACVPIILQSRLQKVKALVQMSGQNNMWGGLTQLKAVPKYTTTSECLWHLP